MYHGYFLPVAFVASYIPNPATWLNQGRWEDELPMGKEHHKGICEHQRTATDEQMEQLRKAAEAIRRGK